MDQDENTPAPLPTPNWHGNDPPTCSETCPFFREHKNGNECQLRDRYVSDGEVCVDWSFKSLAALRVYLRMARNPDTPPAWLANVDTLCNEIDSVDALENQIEMDLEQLMAFERAAAENLGEHGKSAMAAWTPTMGEA